VCGAESQGQIGYLLQVAIGDVFFEREMERPVAALLTLARVRPDDPAFRHPSKPVGPYYDEDEARRLTGELGYTMAPAPSGGWRPRHGPAGPGTRRTSALARRVRRGIDEPEGPGRGGVRADRWARSDRGLGGRARRARGKGRDGRRPGDVGAPARPRLQRQGL